MYPDTVMWGMFNNWSIMSSFHSDFISLVASQQTFTCSKSTVETLEKGDKYVQS